MEVFKDWNIFFSEWKTEACMPGNWPTTVFIRVDPISSNQNSQRLANTKTFKKLIEKKETKRLGDLGPTDSNSPGWRGRKAMHDKLPNTVPVPVWTPYLRNHRSTDCLPNDRLESRWFQDWFSSSTISSRTRMLLIFLMCIPRSLGCFLGHKMCTVLQALTYRCVYKHDSSSETGHTASWQNQKGRDGVNKGMSRG